MTRITDLRVFDLRFPTSQSLDGSDAMNPDPDYSAAYVILDTDAPDLAGHGLTFTIGRGNDICCMAIEAMRHLIVGADLAEVLAHPGTFWRHLTSDSQLRWIGPEKGAIHWRPAQSSMPSGICSPNRPASPSGGSSPRCLRKRSPISSITAISPTC